MKRGILLAFCLFSFLIGIAQTYTIPIPGWVGSQSLNADLAAAPNGHVFFVGRYGYPYEFNGIGVTILDTVGYYSTTNYGIDENNGKIWVANNDGLYEHGSNGWVKFNSQNSPLPTNVVKCVKASGTVVYAGTDLGLIKKASSGWELFDTGNSGIINNQIKSIDVLTNGNVVAATSRGISIYDGTTWANFDSTNSALKSSNINYVKACQNNTFWVATNTYTDTTMVSPGFYLFKNGEFIALSDIENNCLYANISIPTPTKMFCIDANGNLLVNIGGYFKKYTHPDNTPIQTTMLYAGVPTNTIGMHGEYSNYGFDCFISANKLTLFFDTCFASQYVIDSIKLKEGREIIDINNIQSTIRSQGDLYTGYDKRSENRSPKTACTNADFVAALWLGGIDNGGNLHGAAMTYRQTGVDYWPGPLDTVNVACVNNASQYNKIWKINKSMIQDFLQTYQNGSEYIHPDILTWPGNGTGNLAKKLAPFVDVNQNGIYEPLQGEYPELTGDEMLYWVFNDKCDVHSETGCNPLGVEIHGKAYAYVCDDIDPNSPDFALNNTVFYSYTIYNRSINNYHDFYISRWHDVDLGYYMDDYVGCDINRNAGFVYNGDNYDEGPYGFGLNPPMQSYVQLEGPLAPNNDGVDNNHNGVIDEPLEQMLFTNFMYYNNDFSISGNPEDCNDLYGYMQNLWKDGSHTVYNGSNGYGSGTPYNYMFPTPPYSNGEPGDSLPPWNEVSSGNTPGDRRFIMSCGPTTLEPGGIIRVQYATVFSHNNTAPNGANTSLALNNAYVDKVTEWFNNQNYPSCYNPTTVKENTVEPGKLVVYPNPTANTATIMLGNSNSPLDFYVTDMAGKIVLRGQGNTINLEGLKNGMYLLYVDNQKGIFYSKLIKQ